MRRILGNQSADDGEHVGEGKLREAVHENGHLRVEPYWERDEQVRQYNGDHVEQVHLQEITVTETEDAFIWLITRIRYLIFRRNSA